MKGLPLAKAVKAPLIAECIANIECHPSGARGIPNGKAWEYA